MYIPTELQKIQAIEHIFYETQCLELAFHDWLVALQNAPVRQREVNNSTELILIHARALLDFFTKNPREDDMSCDHFGFSRPTKIVDPKIKKRIHKEVAHLTYSRCGLQPPDKAWRFQQFVPAILNCCRNFLAQVERDYGAKIEDEQVRKNLHIWLSPESLQARPYEIVGVDSNPDRNSGCSGVVGHNGLSSDIVSITVLASPGRLTGSLLVIEPPPLPGAV